MAARHLVHCNAESLARDPLLEAWRVFPDDPITWDSDDINQ